MNWKNLSLLLLLASGLGTLMACDVSSGSSCDPAVDQSCVCTDSSGATCTPDGVDLSCACELVEDTNNGDTNNGDTNNGDTNNGDTNNGDTNNGDTNNGDTNNGDNNGDNNGTNNGDNNGEDPCDACGPEQTCEEGVCVDPVVDPCDACGPEQTCEEGVCVDPVVDPCDACGPEQTCEEGVCVDPVVDPCDACGPEQTCEEGVCVDPPSDGWAVYTHPCAGNRTNALYCDDDQTCYVGCGENTAGRGLYVTVDGGATWGVPNTNPAEIFNASRVMDIWRSPDNGLLYVSGEHSNGFRVLSMDSNGNLGEVFRRGNQTDFSFTAGNYRRAANGRQMVESLTGVGFLYKSEDGGDPTESWQNGYGFWQDQFPNGVQILDMEVHNGMFFAAGSTISQPPMVFIDDWQDDSFDMFILPLIDPQGLGAYSGEMWGIDVNDDGITLGGVNHGASKGMIYSYDFTLDAGIRDRANWIEYNTNRIPGLADNATWIQGVCRGPGELVYAVGRESREEWGFVLRSTDGGRNFTDISPYNASPNASDLLDAYRCQVTADGGVIVAGAGGMFAVWHP